MNFHIIELAAIDTEHSSISRDILLCFVSIVGALKYFENYVQGQLLCASGGTPVSTFLRKRQCKHNYESALECYQVLKSNQM